jgi:hypothetical protein
MMTSKLFTKAFSSMPIRYEAKIMCPVEEIGKNSVMPSITERTSAWMSVIAS